MDSSAVDAVLEEVLDRAAGPSGGSASAGAGAAGGTGTAGSTG